MTMGFAQLADWVGSFRTNRPSDESISQAKLLLLDGLGCALAARSENIVREVLELVAELGGTKQARILGTGRKSSVTHAVFANGVLIRTLDLSDFSGKDNLHLGGHPSDNNAVALTIGDWRRSSGQDVLRAMVMAYELYGRLQDQLHLNVSWDHVTASGLVVPAITGFLMHLDADRMSHAFALNAVHCPTLAVIRTGQLSAAKGMANATVAQAAVFQTLLAARGLTGPLHAMEGSRGLTTTVLPQGLSSELLAPIGDKCRIMDAQIKAYPCVSTSQALVAAAFEMRPRIEKKIGDIKAIEITMADIPSVVSQLGDPARRYPTSRETADHSFYFLCAAVLQEGKLTARQFADRNWEGRDVQSLMDRTSISVDMNLCRRAPGGLPARLRVVIQSGEEHTVEVLYPPGHPKNRLTKEGIIDKFARYDAPSFHEVDWDLLVKEIEMLDRAPNLDALLDALCRAR